MDEMKKQTIEKMNRVRSLFEKISMVDKVLARLMNINVTKHKLPIKNERAWLPSKRLIER